MAQTRLNKVLRELNISIDRAVDFLESKGVDIEKSPNTKISEEVYEILSGEFQTDANKKVASLEVSEAKLKEKEELRVQRERELEERAARAAKNREVVKAKAELSGPKQVGKIDLGNGKNAEVDIVKEEVSKVETPKEDVSKAVTQEEESAKESAPIAQPTVEDKGSVTNDKVAKETTDDVVASTPVEKKADDKKTVEAPALKTTPEVPA